MNRAELLDLAGKIERKMADIYRFFDRQFKDNESSSSLWADMAAEEDAHAGFLDAKFKMLMISPDSFGLPKVETDEIEECYNKLEDLKRDLLKNPPELKEAVSFALSMELELVEKSYSRLIHIGDPTIKMIFDELTRGDRHMEQLVKVAKKLGVTISSQFQT
ncbi:MAG: ferritin family protein [bacterium]|nr:ferritin family protein [bacterium]